MFTGIIEELGKVREARLSPDKAALTLDAETVLEDLKVGDSVAVNGVCLTVARVAGGSFSADLSAETIQRTTLGSLKRGMVVNLERALRAGSRLGGHFVQGHVDSRGKLLSVSPSGDGTVMEFGFPQELARYLAYKGSIAVDGISLTVASLKTSSFTVAVIPHTLRATNLKRLKVGDPVNLEVDILAKYLERFFQLGLVGERGNRLTLEYLKEQGF